MAVNHQSNGRKKKDNDDPNAWWNRIDASEFTHTTETDVKQEVRVYDDLDEDADHATGKLIVQAYVGGRKFNKTATMKFDSTDEFDELVDFFVAVQADLAG